MTCSEKEKWDAELARVAMRFVDRAGDVHPGIDDAERICQEFYEAMSAVINRMPRVQMTRAVTPHPSARLTLELPEPAEFQVRIRPTWDAKHNWTIWEKCTPEAAADYERTPLLHAWEYSVRKLYTEQQVRDILAQYGIN